MAVARLLTALLIGGFAVTAAAAGAGRTGGRPLRVRAASLTQDGQQLVWRVELDRSVSPGAFVRDGGSLCLAIERVASATVTGRLCVARARRHQRQLRLVYMRMTGRGSGPGRVIGATVVPGTRELTATFLPAGIGIGYGQLRWQVLSALRPSACEPPAGCVSLFPATPVLTRLHTPRLVGCIASGPPFVYHGSANRRVLALTFDDGPWPDTPRFLDILEREHVPATFFEVGEHIPTYGEGGAIERRMLADGDMIGDHTWSHADVAAAGSLAAGQISRAAAAIRTATGGFTPCLFRAPDGAVSPALIAEARAIGFTTIQWDVDPRDWSLPGAGAIYDNVVSNAHNGAIIIQHDGGGDRSQTLAALPREIGTLRREGYRFLTITELLGQQLTYQ